MYYALRIDGALPAVLAWLAFLAAGGFGVKESVAGANVHWHFLIESDKSMKQLRSSFARKVPELVGNKAYSLTECRDVGKYERYLCKGDSEGTGVDLAWSNSANYSSDRLEELHVAYWNENRLMKKRKAGSMIDWVVDEAKREEIPFSNRQALAKMYIRELGRRGKPINIYSIKSNLNAVQYALCPTDEVLDALVERCDQF